MMNQKKLLNLLAMFAWIMLCDVQISLCSYQEYVVEQKKNPDLTLEDFDRHYADYQQAVRLMASAREFTFAQYLAGVQGDPLYPEYLNAQGDWTNGLTFQQFLDQRDAQVDTGVAVVSGSSDQDNQSTGSIFGLLHDTQKLIDSGAATLVASVAPWEKIFDRQNPEINLVKGYINVGRDVNVQDEHGRSPLLYAVGYNKLSVVKILLTAPKINVNIQNDFGVSPLTRSVFHSECLSITKVLLQAPDINVNIQKDNGDTPLNIAVRRNYIEAVILLLAHPNIDLAIKNNAGQTAFEIAATPEIKNLIVQKEARDKAIRNRTRQNLERQDIDSLNRINVNRTRQGQQSLPADAARNIAGFLNSKKES